MYEQEITDGEESNQNEIEVVAGKELIKKSPVKLNRARINHVTAIKCFFRKVFLSLRHDEG